SPTIMDHRTGFYMLLKDADNPQFSDSSTWWEMFSSYVYSPDDDVAQPEHLALKGELLEALEREKQPLDTQRISLRAVKQFYQRAECNCEDLKQINVEEMKLLIAVFSYSERCRIVDNGYLSYGCTIKEGDEVTVRIKDLQDVAGVVRYKGPVPPYDGTMFGIEILDHQFRRQGSCDGSFQCKRYFKCQPGSGLFVSVDKLCITDTNQGEQARSEEPHKDEAILKEGEKSENKNKNTIMEENDDEKMNKNCNNDNNAANFQNSENELLNGDSEDNNELNVKHDEKENACDKKMNGFLDKSNLETEGLELKSIVDGLQQQLLKVKIELEEKENKWKQERMEWEMKMGSHLVTQNDLRDQVTQLAKQVEDVTVAKCEAEEMLNEEQKRWKKQMKGFSREWEEFERRVLEERTLRTTVEERLTERQRELEQETNQKLAVQTELEQSRNAASQHASDFERHRQYFEYRIRELENTPRDVSVVEPANEPSETRDWIISRDEIHVTGKSLGTGAWGQVVEGIFRACPVAVKRIHDLILSPHNRRLFEREMSIASRCRHPCLLQFVGATNDNGNPLFVTELMDANLRSILESRPLTENEIVTISRDVAMALNYLHLNKNLTHNPPRY
ncbi:hypothetical protein QZH41_019691, partial [Actinostola sp. cb2023]